MKWLVGEDPADWHGPRLVLRVIVLVLALPIALLVLAGLGWEIFHYFMTPTLTPA